MALAFLLLLSIQLASSQISLIASNATYNGPIYVLATDGGSLVMGEIQLTTPSGARFATDLQNGQAKIRATELGEWKFYYKNATATAFVSDEAAAPQGIVLPQQDHLWFALAISAILAAGIIFISFFAHDFLFAQYKVQTSYECNTAHAAIYAKSHSLHDVAILLDGEEVARKQVLQKGESLSVSIVREHEPKISFSIGKKPAEMGAASGKPKAAIKRKLIRASSPSPFSKGAQAKRGPLPQTAAKGQTRMKKVRQAGGKRLRGTSRLRRQRA